MVNIWGFHTPVCISNTLPKASHFSSGFSEEGMTPFTISNSYKSMQVRILTPIPNYTSRP